MSRRNSRRRKNRTRTRSNRSQGWNESLRTRLEASTSMRGGENKALQEQLDQVERNSGSESSETLKTRDRVTACPSVSELEKKLEKAMENCNPTDRETFFPEKIRALHDTMRLVGAVSKGDSDDDLVSIEDENEIYDMSATRLLTYKKDETLSRSLRRFAQAFEILKRASTACQCTIQTILMCARKFEDPNPYSTQTSVCTSSAYCWKINATSGTARNHNESIGRTNQSVES